VSLRNVIRPADPVQGLLRRSVTRAPARKVCHQRGGGKPPARTPIGGRCEVPGSVDCVAVSGPHNVGRKVESEGDRDAPTGWSEAHRSKLTRAAKTGKFLKVAPEPVREVWPVCV
jgi:hypothetical protein